MNAAWRFARCRRRRSAPHTSGSATASCSAGSASRCSSSPAAPHRRCIRRLDLPERTPSRDSIACAVALQRRFSRLHSSTASDGRVRAGERRVRPAALAESSAKTQTPFRSTLNGTDRYADALRVQLEIEVRDDEQRSFGASRRDQGEVTVELDLPEASRSPRPEHRLRVRPGAGDKGSVTRPGPHLTGDGRNPAQPAAPAGLSTSNAVFFASRTGPPHERWLAASLTRSSTLSSGASPLKRREALRHGSVGRRSAALRPRQRKRAAQGLKPDDVAEAYQHQAAVGARFQRPGKTDRNRLARRPPMTRTSPVSTCRRVPRRAAGRARSRRAAGRGRRRSRSR